MTPLPEPQAGASARPWQIADSFQERVAPWMDATFGAMIAGDKEERAHRFLEEALELVQSTGTTAGEAHQLVDYAFGRPIGETRQEVGGVMVTLAALCLAHRLDMHEAAETELARVWTKVEQIRAKQAAKPKHSPLPERSAHDPLVTALTTLRAKFHRALVVGGTDPEFADVACEQADAALALAAPAPQLAEVFASYEAQAVRVSKALLRQAFMAGAQHTWASIMTMLEEGEDPTAADLGRMEKIQVELDVFAAEFARDHYPTRGSA